MNIFQTTVGRLITENELSTQGRSKAFYASMSRTSKADGLKKMFSQEFAEEHRAKLKVFDRRQICSHLQVEDGGDSIQLVHDMIEKLPSNSVLFLDEHPIKTKEEEPEDWSGLRNTRGDEITLIVSFQPLDFKPTLATEKVEIKMPENADVINLSHQYRSTQNITSFTNKLQRKVPVQYSSLEATPGDLSTGPSVAIVHIEKKTDMAELTSWLHYQLWQTQCTSKQVTILSTKKTQADARRMFSNSEFESCITNVESFLGCESPVIILFYEKEKRVSYAELINMWSRAQYKAGIKYHLLFLKLAS